MRDREKARQRNARYRARHRKELLERQRALSATPERQAYRAKKSSEYRFGGLRDAVLERDGYRCVHCGEPWVRGSRRIVVHHLDHDLNHNSMENLLTLCRRCHPLMHQADWTIERRQQHSETMKRIGSGKWNAGRKRDPVTVAKTAAANRGRKHSPESIEKMRQAKRMWWAKQSPERKSEIAQRSAAGRKRSAH